ncbi:MAG: thiamine pyrophosphate-dependent dehydrogenase E1 component subunit alpha [Verrucomicrobiota bacterium]
MSSDWLNHQSILAHGDYTGVDATRISAETGFQLWRQMKRLRMVEQGLHDEYHPADEMRCPIHFCIGQESIPAALSLLLKQEDYLFSHHRSHGYYFAKGSPLRELFAEIYGKATGADGGKAGSQDISHHATRFYSGAILSGAVAIAAGMATGLKIDKSSSISVAGFGEGATDEGAFWETLNYVGKEKLPLLLVCENNRYATYSDQLKRQSLDNISERVRAFGLQTIKIFGNDTPLAYETLKEAIEGIRSGKGPVLVEAYTYRWNSHVGPEDDGKNAYRSSTEMDYWKRNCPITLLEASLKKAGSWDVSVAKRAEEEILKEIQECFNFAKSSPFPKGVDWWDANWESKTPLADKWLVEEQACTFDHSQADAKLGPY